MVKHNLNNEPVKNKTDQLLQEFIAELDVISSNGVVKHLDMARISDLREHYISQCEGNLQARLAEQIDLILSSKLHYFDRERNLSLTELTESRIIEKIKVIVRSLKENAPKFIGMALSMRWFNPVHLARTFLQPAVANSLLTFTVVLNPPMIESLPVQESRVLQETVLDLKSNEERNSKLYAELLNVRPYNEYTVISSVQPKFDKKSVAKKIPVNTAGRVELTNTEKEGIIWEATNPTGNLSIIDSDKAVKETKKKSALPTEVRPISEIQHIFYLNDNRLKSCLQNNPRDPYRLKGKISVRFDISPSGHPKNIQVIDSVLSAKMADRLTMQIYQLRFSQVDKKYGDQSVLHTLFF